MSCVIERKSSWASSLGNLGGYIITAKLLSVLSALGISVGAGAFSAFIAVIGGPITLFVALAVIVGSAIYVIFGKSWQGRLAKKLVAAVKKKDYERKVRSEQIKPYWSDTRKAFDAGAEALEMEYQQKVKELDKLLQNYDVESLRSTIIKYEEFENFIKGVPII